MEEYITIGDMCIPSYERNMSKTDAVETIAVIDDNYSMGMLTSLERYAQICDTIIRCTDVETSKYIGIIDKMNEALQDACIDLRNVIG